MIFRYTIWRVICKAYIYVSWSGVHGSKFFFYNEFSYIQSTIENFAKGSNSTNTPQAPSTAPITSQEATSPATPETNVLPKATQSNPSLPAVTTVPSDTWKLIEQEFEKEIKDIKKLLNWEPLFIILSKKKPGFQFIEVLNLMLMS